MKNKRNTLRADCLSIWSENYWITVPISILTAGSISLPMVCDNKFGCINRPLTPIAITIEQQPSSGVTTSYEPLTPTYVITNNRGGTTTASISLPMEYIIKI